MLTIKNSSIYRTNYHFSKFLFSFFLLSETFHFIPLYSVFTDQTTKWILGKKKLQFIGETFSNNFFSYCFFFTLASSTSFFFYADQCFFDFCYPLHFYHFLLLSQLWLFSTSPREKPYDVQECRRTFIS